MPNCNTTQLEVGGKDLLLKKCKEFTAETTATSADIEVTAHGAKVGDIVKFQSVADNTVINTTSYYIVREVVDANTFTIKATLTGAAIVMDDTDAALTVDIFRGIGGLRSKSFSLSAEGIDITSQDSDEWSKMLDGAGIRSASVSGDGVYTNEAVFNELHVDWFAKKLVCILFLDAKTGRLYEGCFKITTLDISGDYNAEGSYSAAFESSGEIYPFLFA